MKLKTTLFGNVYQFKDVKEVLAKANELRSGDVLAGVAAASSQERENAGNQKGQYHHWYSGHLQRPLAAERYP